MELEEFEENVKKWSSDRGILKNGKRSGQVLKLISEVGELADNLAKGLSIEDDIGDCMVLLTNIKNMEVDEIDDNYMKLAYILEDLSELMLCDFHSDWKGTYDYGFIKNELEELAELNNTTLERSCEVAWNDIKDRKGFMNEQGVFVKSTDKNYEELKKKG